MAGLSTLDLVSLGLLVLGILAVGDLLRQARRMQRAAWRREEEAVELPEGLLPYLPVEAAADAEPSDVEEVAAATLGAPDAAVGPAAVDELAELGLDVEPLVITHTDFDGLTSGALLLRALGPETRIRFSSARYLPVTLEESALRAERGQRIHIADLPLDADRIEVFHRSMLTLAERGAELIWFDHHVWPLEARELAERHCRELHLDTRAHTAAELIRARRLPADDPVADRILALTGRTASGVSEAWLRDWTHLLAEIVRVGTPHDVRVRILEKLSADRELSPAERWLIRKGRRRQELTESVAGDRHRMVRTQGGRRMLIIDARPFHLAQDERGRLLLVVRRLQPEITVARKACERWKGDLALVLWRNDRFTLSRGEDPTVDFRPLFSVQELQGRRVRVRGHAYAAGVHIELSWRSRLRSVFDWRPVPEVERLIGLICRLL